MMTEHHFGILLKDFKNNMRLVSDVSSNSQGYGLGYMGVEFTSGGDCTKNGFL